MRSSTALDYYMRLLTRECAQSRNILKQFIGLKMPFLHGLAKKRRKISDKLRQSRPKDDFLFLSIWLEDRPPNPHQRGTFFHRYLEIPRHPHATLRQLVEIGQL